ncbi:winged helix DNA-binding domain-containing protein [Chitinophaga flava]|uniref:Winged helix DNA-binding domain-containing protein n=1 Tax=Chitinophaga flava TaxID=2259036 RepID=A0A365XTY4_9BACT|nr:winged helix DNA-binding domain-containing protein [Chitinophaga flava]RBL89837.1 winged helix DNA-binding domain-containing protein [Chitinophaga flava]
MKGTTNLTTMNAFDITLQRLQYQHLLTPEFRDPSALVSWMGAVQAQDYAASKWAIGQRLKDITETMLDDAMGNWSIIRTHVLRPTWHFVAPQDLRWMLELTAPRIKAFCSYNDNRWGITPAMISKSHKILEKLLRDKQQLNRLQIAPALREAGISTDEYRLGALLMHAELDRIICSGPRHGKQFTYVLLEEHVAPVASLSREASLATLALRYFTSHGPATLQDYAWWSGLTITEAKRGLDAIQDELVSVAVDGKTYWMSPDQQHPAAQPSVFLLPAFDEFTVAYKKRDIQQLLINGSLPPMASLGPVIVVDGQITGTWKRSIRKNDILLELQHFQPLKKSHQPALKAAIQQYSDFTGSPVSLK